MFEYLLTRQEVCRIEGVPDAEPSPPGTKLGES